jgi:hypothetical protein
VRRRRHHRRRGAPEAPVRSADWRAFRGTTPVGAGALHRAPTAGSGPPPMLPAVTDTLGMRQNPLREYCSCRSSAHPGEDDDRRMTYASVLGCPASDTVYPDCDAYGGGVGPDATGRPGGRRRGTSPRQLDSPATPTW